MQVFPLCTSDRPPFDCHLREKVAGLHVPPKQGAMWDSHAFCASDGVRLCVHASVCASVRTCVCACVRTCIHHGRPSAVCFRPHMCVCVYASVHASVVCVRMCMRLCDVHRYLCSGLPSPARTHPPHLIPSHPIPSHPIPTHHIPSHLISSRLISSHLIPSRLTSSHLISSHLIPPHLISSHPIPPYLIVSSHLISSHPIPYHIISSLNLAVLPFLQAMLNFLTSCALAYLSLAYLTLTCPTFHGRSIEASLTSAQPSLAYLNLPQLSLA